MVYFEAQSSRKGKALDGTARRHPPLWSGDTPEHRARIKRVVNMPKSELPPTDTISSAGRLARYAEEAAAARASRKSDQTEERIRTMAEKQAPKQTAKDQGVPDVYLSDKGSFRPGMDARYKSDLVNSALGISDPKALQTFEPEDAKKRLEQRGWTGYLDRKREILEAKAAKADAKKAERAAAKKEGAAESSPEMKEALAETAAAQESKDVTPDPKPARRQRAKRGAKK